MYKSRINHLPAQVIVLMENRGTGDNARSIRRPVLVCRLTGLVHELPSVFIYRQKKNKSFNTQMSTLYDLGFYLAWCDLKKLGNLRWISPEERIKKNLAPITAREIADLCNWYQRTSYEIQKAITQTTDSVAYFPVGEPVETSTTNRKILTIANYLEWLIAEFIEDQGNGAQGETRRATFFQQRLRRDFTCELNQVKKAVVARSLSAPNLELVQSNLSTLETYPNTAHGNRDRLIVKLLLNSGLRAGELLKLQTTDVDDNYKISEKKIKGMLQVVRRPNDKLDERKDEPAVKTFPGRTPISRALASELKSYIIGDRRVALNRRIDGVEHPYLFVCHSGMSIGKPISRRNLNRIVQKLKSFLKDEDMSPHVCRHTHFTEFANAAEDAGISEVTIRSLLIQRGHWAPNSKMPERYTTRRLQRIEASLVAERDKLLEK